MSLVLNWESLAKLINQEVTFLNSCYLKLFTNNITPDGSQVASDYVEPTDSGYSGTQNCSFGAGTLNGSNQGEINGSAITETFTLSGGSFQIYGYWLYDPATSKAVYSELKSGGPVTISNPGDTYTVVLKKTLDTA